MMTLDDFVKLVKPTVHSFIERGKCDWAITHPDGFEYSAETQAVIDRRLAVLESQGI